MRPPGIVLPAWMQGRRSGGVAPFSANIDFSSENPGTVSHLLALGHRVVKMHSAPARRNDQWRAREMLPPEGRIFHGITIDDHEPCELSCHNAKTAGRLITFKKPSLDFGTCWQSRLKFFPGRNRRQLSEERNDGPAACQILACRRAERGVRKRETRATQGDPVLGNVFFHRRTEIEKPQRCTHDCVVGVKLVRVFERQKS